MPGRRAWLVAFSLLPLGARGVEAASLYDFARCLSRAGATYYTAAWCPHCARQNEMFGDALSYLRVVDCTRGCEGVSSFPTWVFADRSHLRGVASLSTLAARTGCSLAGSRSTDWGREPAGSGGSGRGTRERWVGGAKIIDVPGR